MAGALLLDHFLGEAKYFHPLVGFGNVANWLEKKLNSNHTQTNPQGQYKNSQTLRMKGALAWLLLIVPLPLCLYLLQTEQVLWCFMNTFILYFALGQRSLKHHAMQIYYPLQQQDLARAQHFTAYMVSRDTTQLSSDEMTRATVESVLENGHDAVIASLVYFVIGGAPLVLLHRLSNTLDAMWGYKNPRFLYFGWWAARADDHLGWLSAYCTSILYAMQIRRIKRTSHILVQAWRQSRLYKSKNGGLCMAAGAAVLGFCLGGSAYYHGKLINSPPLGCGRPVAIDDIPRSLSLVRVSAALFCLLVFILGLSGAFFNG